MENLCELKLDEIEDVLMNMETLCGGVEQKIIRSAEAKLQKIWDIVYQ